jgi:hypothetical protein
LTALAAKVARTMNARRRGAWLAILSIAVVTITSGCERLFLFPAPRCHLRGIEQCLCRPIRSASTSSLLEHLELEDLAQSHPEDAFSLLERGASSHPNDPRYLIALAELAGEISRMVPAGSTEAMLWSRDAAVFAVFCLAELKAEKAGTVAWCTAQNVYNEAVARCLRLMQTSAKSDQSTWCARLVNTGMIPATTVPLWTGMGFDTLQPTDEWKVAGPGPFGLRAGLGVPVIAQRTLEGADLTSWKPFGPHDAVFAATVVIRPHGPLATWREQPVELVLHDPAHEEIFDFLGKQLPLAMDLTTPLIRRLNQSQMRNYEFQGVFDADAYLARAGAYALDPYQPGKIPVVLVAGLWSSPATWIPMLDSLRGDPLLRASYQFWVVLYPSGYPLPVAALSARRALREIRLRFDPQGTDSALNQMVILGKSTGGQVTRMLVQPSGEELWNAVFARPMSEIHAPPELRAELAEMFCYQPEPYIRRVIFATTPHRGGKLANHPKARLAVRLIRGNKPLRSTWDLLQEANDETVFQPFFQHRSLSSIDGMAAGNPLITAVDAQSIAPEIPYHSIIANIHVAVPTEKSSDGLVRYRSAHLDGAVSEQIVIDGHSCEANPQFITEVRRILLLHLSEIEGWSPTPE